MSQALSADDAIVDFLRLSAGADRATLARELGLAAPTVISAVRRLVAAGDLVEEPATGPRSAAGRPARRLRLAGPAPVVALVRWRAGRIQLAAIDATGDLRAEEVVRPPGPVAQGPDLAALAERAAAVAGRVEGHRLAAIVFSVPAPFLHGHGTPRPVLPRDVAPTPFSVMAIGDLEGELAERFGLPVLIENDANLAAVGEQWAGAARDLDTFLYLRVTDHDFGSAVVANGQLVRGARGYAGEIAHLQMDVEGPLCACGGRGCLHTQVRALVVESAQAAYDRPISFGDLARLAGDGDTGAGRMLRDFGRAVGRPLAHLCTFLDPQRLVVDTTMGEAVEHIIAGITDALETQAPPVIGQNVEVVASPLGERAEGFGALELPRVHARRRSGA